MPAAPLFAMCVPSGESPTSCFPLQVLVLGKPGGQCSAVPTARHWTFAELDKQVGVLLAWLRCVWAAAVRGERHLLQPASTA